MAADYTFICFESGSDAENKWYRYKEIQDNYADFINKVLNKEIVENDNLYYEASYAFHEDITTNWCEVGGLYGAGRAENVEKVIPCDSEPKIITKELISNVMVAMNIPKGNSQRDTKPRTVKKFLTDNMGKMLVSQAW